MTQPAKFQSNSTNRTIYIVGGSSSNGQTILNALTGENA